MTMEINRVTPANALQAVLAALNEIAEAHAAAAPGESAAGPASGPDVRGLSGVLGSHEGLAGLAGAASAGHGAEHAAKAATADSPVVHPDARLDRGAESALVQSFARPETPLPGASRAGDNQPATPALAGNDFSLPADQLLNAAVIGLQVEPAFPWQLQRRGFDAAPPQLPEPRNDSPMASPVPRQEAQRAGEDDSGPGADRRDRADHDADEEASQDDDAPAQAPVAEPHPSPWPGDADAHWAEPLSRALREALRERPAAPALLAAAEQWRLGRCVVLACPQGLDPAGPGWAFVLWPRRGSLSTLPLALFGLRVEARLHWSRLPPALAWCHARVMKEQHPRQGRQLVALDARGTATVPCEVQLGPVPLRTPRWRDACVRIDAMRQFWNALGQQWSVTVVVGSRPLAGVGPAVPKEAPWEA
jgi:hypothetical protein